MQKMRYRYPTEDCGFIELDHRMLRKEFVKQLRNVSGVQMVSVFMMKKNQKYGFFSATGASSRIWKVAQPLASLLQILLYALLVSQPLAPHSEQHGFFRYEHQPHPPHRCQKEDA